MTDQLDQSIVVTRQELYLLAELLALPRVMGIEDPFLGFATTDVADALKSVQEHLTARGLLLVKADGSVMPASLVTRLVRPNGSARVVLVASMEAAGADREQLLIYSTPPGFVEQAFIPGGLIRISALRERDTLESHLDAFFDVPDVEAAPGGRLALKESIYSDARRLAHGGHAEACRQVLVEAGLASEACEALVATLTRPIHAGSLLVLHRDERELRYGDSVAWISGHGGCWRVQVGQRSGDSYIQLTPTSTEIASVRLRSIVGAA